MAKKNNSKMCSCHPVVMSQGAINILYNWFPDSNGNLDVDDVWDSISHHYSDEHGMSFCGDSPEADELITKVSALCEDGKHTSFSPVLSI